MTIEGILEFEAVRDFLYSKMRGLREPRQGGAATARATSPAGDEGELAATLRAVAAEVRALRETIERRRGAAGS